MGRRRMHADQVGTDPRLLRRLLHEKFPQWAELPIEQVASYGTDHDIYRLADHLVARLPCIAWASGQAAKEAEWLPRLSPHLPRAGAGAGACGGRPAGARVPLRM